MKPVIIIAIAVVSLIPIHIFAQSEPEVEPEPNCGKGTELVEGICLFSFLNKLFK